MSKVKTLYACSQCGHQSRKWLGQCPECQSWNSFEEESGLSHVSAKHQGYAGEQKATLESLDGVDFEESPRYTTGLKELDHVLGGGLVPGAVVLVGGDPGVGKSTILLQCMANVSQAMASIYVSGEESLQQIAMRAKRLNLKTQGIRVLAQTQVELILSMAKKHKPAMMVIDSIQTVFCQEVQSAPGSVSQVRESAARLVRYAKENNTTLLLVGHVTKEGALAGPRVLEHMVDAVLYFEGQKDNRFRAVRAVKNRFGAVNALGVFAMTDKGLKEVSNPSAIFLSRNVSVKSGSVVMVAWEGTRALLVEVQALVSESYSESPRRVTLGLDANRLAMLLAVLFKHAKVSAGANDVFVNAVGGLRLSETGADLAMVVAMISSFKDRVVPNDWAFFGEVGLSGEVRPVQGGVERINEAQKHGFSTVVVPKANQPSSIVPGITIVSVASIKELIDLLKY